MSRVPPVRIRLANDRAPRADGQYVLYWMTAFRRLRANFALERAVVLARELERPLVILEALRCDYRWASDRLHGFVIDGMAEHAAALAGTSATYLPYVERSRGEGKGLIETLARHAAIVVADDYPCFFLPKMLAAAAARIDVRLEAVDSNGIVPLRADSTTFSTAHAYRAYLQRTLRQHLDPWPGAVDFSALPRLSTIDPITTTRWPMAALDELQRPDELISSLPIDHRVGPTSTRGGEESAGRALRRFIETGLRRYADDQSHPDLNGTSGLSPYLHFGHLAVHDVFAAVASAEGWTSRKLAPTSRGARTGWWGFTPGAEAFLDQLITWREVGFNMCATRPDDYDRYDALPSWARKTLAQHARDRRPHTYSIEQFAGAATADDVWNAAQRQLVQSGWMHNYLRMLWGKKILEWTRTPELALETMIEIMNRYALDGRDPNSYSGYCWTLGRYDRPWGPEREIFGTVRYMSSENTKKKLKMRRYLDTYGR